MARVSSGQMQRLRTMGIEHWVPRGGVEDIGELRVRLSSGRGRWLLVQRQPWRGQFASLLADITATLGVEECRFGQWGNTEEAGVAVSELESQAISHVLSFGPPPKGETHPIIIEVPTMQALSEDPNARASLWQAIAPWVS